MNVTERRPNEPARDYAYRELCQNIISFALPPGSEISVQKISEELQISRTPVREAFLQLQQERIVEIFPQSGSRIAFIDFELANDSRFVRLALERFILEIVCSRARESDIALLENSLGLQEYYCSKGMVHEFLAEDNNFHRILFHISGHDNIYSARDYLSIHFNRIRALWVNTYGNDILQKVHEHREIVHAVQERDIARSRRAIDRHLSGYSKMEQEQLRQFYPEYFQR